MSLYHQHERKTYQDGPGKASTKTVGDIDKVEVKSNADPGDYHGMLQTLSSYLRMINTVLGSQSAHKREVAAIRKTEDKDGPLREY